jgi:NTE family protein
MSNNYRIQTNLNSVKYEYTNWDGKCINTLIFKGGGTKAIVYVGALRKLEEVNMLKKIKFLAGTSSGAQTAALISCGYTSNQIENIFKYIPWKKIFKYGFLNKNGICNLFLKFGFFDSKNLENYIEELLYLKTGKKKISFKELYQKSKIHLKIGVCSLTDREFKYIDHLSYPDMPVSTGLSASSSIPFLFSCVKWKNEVFVDGGLIGNLPITAFPDNKCLAFNLFNIKDKTNVKKNPTNIFTYSKIIFDILYKYAQKMFSRKNAQIQNIEFIDIFTNNLNLLDTNINNSTINKLTGYGYNAVEKFLHI